MKRLDATWRSRACSGGVFIQAGFEELIVPALWEQQTFVDKGGQEIVGQMYAFNDKKGRPICLIPEATGPVQELWRNQFGRARSEKLGRARSEKRWFYITKCYRYEQPQLARYREFTQLGVELLGGTQPGDRAEVIALLKQFLALLPITVAFDDNVKRGLGYYTEGGFEVRCEALGAQKQVAGGGRYAEGVGWAVGLDRLLVAEARERAG
jgi:histidyl-tRNA synthetase